MHDLIVVGAGPVGSYLSSLCGEKMDVIVLEEDSEAGKKVCSGLVSPRLIDMLPAPVKKKGLIEHILKRAVVHFMGKELELRKSGTAAYVIDRNVLDKRLAENAESAGADVRFGERVVNLSTDNEKVSVKTSRRQFEAKLVAGCDGARSVVARSIGSKPGEILNGLVLYVDKEDYSDTAEMWFDKSLVKDGFFWRIPRGQRTELGCMGYGLSFPVLEKFFDTGKMRITGKYAAPVPIGLTTTQGKRTLLVGDSACQVKPWSGGGITYGMLAARDAAKVISGAVKKNNSDLSLYEELWKKRLLNDIKAGLIVREFYKDLNLDGLSGIIEKAESLKREGDKVDFDFPFSSMLIG
jgi:geranylgeranyl reductase family protein